MRKLIACGAALVAACAFTVSGALGGTEATPGVTARSITIGGTFPLTGPAALYAPIPGAMKAYFSYINARKGPDGKRGVMGRQIVWKYYDDGYNPANTVQLTRRLVEQDKVFATVGQLGTEPVLATREYMNSRKVPQVFVASGASVFGSDYKQYPWTIGWMPDYISEGRLYGLQIRQNHPGKKIAIVYQNDDYGKDILYGVQAALGSKYVQENVVAKEPIEVTATSVVPQMVKVKASGAQVLVVLTIPTPAIRIIATAKALGIAPEAIYTNLVAVVAPALKAMAGQTGPAYIDGMLSATFLKDPTSPKWNDDAAMKQFREIIAKYGGGMNANDFQVMYGVALAESFVQALYKAGKNPTRASLMNAVLSLNSPNRFLLPGIRLKTSKTDHFVITQMQLQELNGQSLIFTPVGKLVDGRPRGGR